VFALGAGVSVYEGIIHIAHPEEAVSPLIAYSVLIFAFLLEGGSTWAAFRDFKEAKGSLGWLEAVRRSKDPPAFIVLLENGAAMVGLVVAGFGLVIAQWTGDPFFDGAASIVIGVILGLTALLLAVEAKALLIGEAADPELVEGLRALTIGHGEVTGVGEILTLHSAPDQITAMMSVDFDDSITAGKVETIVDQIESEASAQWPEVKRLYIRPRRNAQDRTSLPHPHE
jgi:divalent metal cation (Fe/Co/Zn/Cd) transporter